MKKQKVANAACVNVPTVTRPVILSFEEAASRVSIQNYLHEKNFNDVFCLFDGSFDILRLDGSSIFFVTFRYKEVRYIVYMYSRFANVDHPKAKFLLKQFYIKSFRKEEYTRTDINSYSDNKDAILRFTPDCVSAWVYNPATALQV